MKIRRLEKKDKKQFSELYAEFYEYSRKKTVSPKAMPFFILKESKKSLEINIKKHFSKNKIVFVAEHEKKLIAYICGKIISKRPKALSKEGYIELWFTSGSYRRKGIGSQLYRVLVEEFEKLNCTHLGIIAHVDNPLAANFYRKLGFIDYSINLKKKL